jgi:hypothetical protein
MNRSAHRIGRVTSSLVSVLPFVCILALAPPVESADITPRVINGTAEPFYGRAAVAIETPETYCTAGLWKPRVLVTAAHCVIGEGRKGSAIAPSDLTVFKPGAARKAGPAPVSVTEIIVDSRRSGIRNDIAFLVLSAPLGTPIITRLATPAEVVSLTKAGATVHFIGYGLTGSSSDPNSDVSDLPLGVTEVLDVDSESGGIGSFETVGNGQRGTCVGDSGGPWLAQVGAEVLYLGPLVGGSGPPCDDPQDTAWAAGAIASAHGKFIARALLASGETAAFAPASAVTCTKIRGSESACVNGTSWVYDRCWSGSKASLEKWVAGVWKRFQSTTAQRSSKCGKRDPYNVVFRGVESAGTARFRVVLSRQTGLRRNATEQFSVTHTSTLG